MGLDVSDAQIMTSKLREELTAKAPRIELSGKIEADEVYIVGGHKWNSDAARLKRRGRLF